MSRGVLTQEITNLSLELLGEEITTEQLRLLPYIQFCMMNSGYIDLTRINQSEWKCLFTWKANGNFDIVEDGKRIVSMTREFWDAMNAILYVAYIEA